MFLSAVSASKARAIRRIRSSAVLFSGVFLQEQAVRGRKRLAMHEPVEDAIQPIRRLDVMEIPCKNQDRGFFKRKIIDSDS